MTAGLDTVRDFASRAQDRTAKQASRWWKARSWLWRNSTRPGSTYCRRYARHDVQITTRGAGSVGTKGLAVCGLNWICPQCAGVAAAKRADEIRQAIILMGDVAMVTLTTAHTWSASLKATLDQLRHSWRKTVSGKGAIGANYIRVLEVTHGRAGWHPHFHVIVPAAEADALVERWLQVNPLAAVTAQDVSERADPLAYLTREVLGARVKTRSHWSLLLDAIEGDDESAFHWAEFESTMIGVQQVTWSRKLRAAVAPVTDEEAADDDQQEAKALPVATISRDSWDRMARNGITHVLMGYLAAWDFRRAEEWSRRVGLVIRFEPWIQLHPNERTLW